MNDCVVVIDDDASIRTSLEQVLKETYDVRTCVDGLDGVLDRCRERVLGRKPVIEGKGPRA